MKHFNDTCHVGGASYPVWSEQTDTYSVRRSLIVALKKVWRTKSFFKLPFQCATRLMIGSFWATLFMLKFITLQGQIYLLLSRSITYIYTTLNIVYDFSTYVWVHQWADCLSEVWKHNSAVKLWRHCDPWPLFVNRLRGRRVILSFQTPIFSGNPRIKCLMNDGMKSSNH